MIYRRPCLQNAHAGVCSGGGTEIRAIHGIHYFCNPSNIDGRVYVLCMSMVRVRVSIRVSIRVRIRVSVRVWVWFRVCHDMFRTRSSMLDRLWK